MLIKIFINASSNDIKTDNFWFLKFCVLELCIFRNYSVALFIHRYLCSSLKQIISGQSFFFFSLFVYLLCIWRDRSHLWTPSRERLTCLFQDILCPFLKLPASTILWSSGFILTKQLFRNIAHMCTAKLSILYFVLPNIFEVIVKNAFCIPYTQD